MEPATLIIQLKRYFFCSKEQKRKKRHDSIHNSETIKLPSGSSYNLSSIVNVGSHPNEGHYNLFIQDKKTDSYVLVDDLHISTCQSISSEMNSLSYILFYAKIWNILTKKANKQGLNLLRASKWRNSLSLKICWMTLIFASKIFWLQNTFGSNKNQVKKHFW